MEDEFDAAKLMRLVNVGLKHDLIAANQNIQQKDQQIVDLQNQLGDLKGEDKKLRFEWSHLKSQQTIAVKDLESNLAAKDAIITDLTNFMKKTQQAIIEKLSKYRLPNQLPKSLPNQIISVQSLNV